MRIIAYSVEQQANKVKVVESTSDKVVSDDFETLISFLSEQYENTIKVCWNLNETVAPLLKLMGEKTCGRLFLNKRCYFAPYNLFYVPDKVFSITHIPSKEKLNLYGIDQYFPDKVEPEDAEQIAQLGEYLIKELNAMGLYPEKLTSPVAIYDQCVLSHVDIPNMNDMPKEAAKLAYQCAGKLWIEAYQLGYWEKAYDYDIISSFPSEVVKLIDFRKCQWIQKAEMVSNAIYGYCDVEVTIYEETNVSPIIYISENGESSTPTGTWHTCLTKKEIEFIEKWKIGEVKIYDGWWCCHPNPEKLSAPLEIVMKRLLEHKSKPGLKSMLAKRMAVGVYGKMGEDRGDKLGPYFNPCWFAEISTNIRLAVAEFIYKHKLQENLIHVSVDGVLADKEAELTGEDFLLPDNWKEDYAGEAIVFSSGNVFIKERKPKGLHLEDIKRAFKEHPKMGYYEWKIPRVVGLGDALSRSFDDLGTDKMMISSLDFYRAEHEREFVKLPKNGGQLIGNKFLSKPHRIGRS